MEPTPLNSKKEIVVKRLSAFQFSVEVNDEKHEKQATRVSVIQKAPAAAVVPSVSNSFRADKNVEPKSPQHIPLQEAICYRIVEVLLWTLLGEERLSRFCGYPNVSPCQLLSRVIALSQTSSKAKANTSECTSNFKCFMKHVEIFLRICAPTENHWSQFGWKNLSSRDILIKIYIEELLPNYSQRSLTGGNLVMAYADIQMMLQWDAEGVTLIKKINKHNREKSNQQPIWEDICDTKPTHERKHEASIRAARKPYFRPPPRRPPPFIEQQNAFRPLSQDSETL